MSPDDRALTRSHARSFAGVAEAYDRARPSYPDESIGWLVPSEKSRVLELGAGTGKLTELLVSAGHDVIATDPLPEMLDHLRRRVPGVAAAVATAERIPLASRSVDVIVCAQAFHWFEHDVAMPEIARVLRPGGVLALVWNMRDEGIPWVRKLGAVIGSEDRPDLAAPLEQCEYFGPVEYGEFRFWQTVRRPGLFDLVRSRSYIATLSEPEREDVLDRVGALYDDYGRGPDGMQLPYLTRCFRSVVTDAPPPPVVIERVGDEALALIEGEPDEYDPDATQAIQRPDTAPHAVAKPVVPPPPEDSGTLLIDFR
ncbi:MAG: class SAM-dependent methyltransferase [Marmoricola sp.]|nr:class SAM-dependent methyltransferase [Marmoricola sp.]